MAGENSQNRNIAPSDKDAVSGRSLSAALKRKLTVYFASAFGFSIAVNLIFLVSPLYMMQVYDRVLTSGSIDTLIVLTSLAAFLMVVNVAADGGRRRVLARAGQALGEGVDGISLRKGLSSAKISSAQTLDAVGNLARVQNILGQGAIAPLFDLPFAPIFIGLLFLINPILGMIGLGGAVVLIAIAFTSDRLSKSNIEQSSLLDKKAQRHLNHVVRQRAAIVSMGMISSVVEQWQKLRRGGADSGVDASTLPTFLSSVSKSIRMMLQIGILGAGAALAVFGHETAGTIIAGSIIMGRGLAPIDQTVAIWRQLVLGRKAWGDLCVWIDDASDASGAPSSSVTPMQRPNPVLKFEEFSIGIPGLEQALLPEMSIALKPGAIVALLGPSGAGKTSFLQTLVGAWPSHHGLVRLGDRDITTWDAEDRGRFIGYLPQHVELLTGTIFDNIRRFTPCDEQEVFTATQRVGCHQLILSLPKGYDTPIGEGGQHLSAGQRQAVGLARAFFRNPSLLVLDEPTAHLDAGLAAGLTDQFADMARQPEAERDMTAIIATHDPRLIHAANFVMIIRDRKIVISPRDEYMRKVSELQRGQTSLASSPIEPGGGKIA